MNLASHRIRIPELSYHTYRAYLAGPSVLPHMPLGMCFLDATLPKDPKEPARYQAWDPPKPRMGYLI